MPENIAICMVFDLLTLANVEVWKVSEASVFENIDMRMVFAAFVMENRAF